MAKSSRGGLTHYEKQDQTYSQFQRIIRKSEFEKRNPHYAEETQTEMLIRKGKEDKAKYAVTAKSNSEKIFISHYNPNNPLNGSSSWSKEQWAEYKLSQNLQNK